MPFNICSFPLGLHRLLFSHLLSTPALPSPRGAEESTLKSALKAQNAPSNVAVPWHAALPTLPPSNGEKPLEPWILLEVEF